MSRLFLVCILAALSTNVFSEVCWKEGTDCNYSFVQLETDLSFQPPSGETNPQTGDRRSITYVRERKLVNRAVLAGEGVDGYYRDTRGCAVQEERETVEECTIIAPGDWNMPRWDEIGDVEETWVSSRDDRGRIIFRGDLRLSKSVCIARPRQ
jgi:hypothetical protein